MQNFLLQAYCIHLYDSIAKFLAAQKRHSRIAVIENCHNKKKLQPVNFIRAGKKYFLPFVVFNTEFQIIAKKNLENDCRIDNNTFDVVLSFFNLHSLSNERQIQFIQKIQRLAPKAIFLDYENPERNLAYLGYFSFVLSQYAACFLEKMFTSQKNSLSFFHEYCKNGALEGILYQLPHILPEHSVKILDRRHLGCGAIGMAYLTW